MCVLIFLVKSSEAWHATALKPKGKLWDLSTCQGKSPWDWCFDFSFWHTYLIACRIISIEGGIARIQKALPTIKWKANRGRRKLSVTTWSLILLYSLILWASSLSVPPQAIAISSSRQAGAAAASQGHHLVVVVKFVQKRAHFLNWLLKLYNLLYLLYYTGSYIWNQPAILLPNMLK